MACFPPIPRGLSINPRMDTLSRYPSAHDDNVDNELPPHDHLRWLMLSFSLLQGYYSDLDGRRRPRKSIELPPLNFSNITSDPYSSRPREILPSLLAASPPGRSSTLPPLQRPLGPSRPRKQSISKKSRESHHKKKPSRGSAADWLRRIQNEERIRPGGHDRKALSAEPSADYGKRWEDLIDAADQAASAAGDVDEDRTPVSKLLSKLP